MPACNNFRINECSGLVLGQSAFVILSLSLVDDGFVSLLGLSGVNIGRCNQTLGSLELRNYFDAGFGVVDGFSQGCNSGLQGLFFLGYVCGLTKHGLQTGVGGIAYVLSTLQCLCLLAEFFNLCNQGTKLHVVNVSFSTVVLNLEVIPDTPQVGVVLQLDTDVQRAVGNLNKDRLDGVETICERYRCVAHAVLRTGLQGEGSSLFVGEEYGQVVVVRAILTIESLSRYCIHTIGSFNALTDGEYRMVGFCTVVGVVTTGKILVGAIVAYNPLVGVAVVASEVEVVEQYISVHGLFFGSVNQSSLSLVERNNSPLNIRIVGIGQLLTQHCAVAVISVECAVLSLGDGEVAILQLGDDEGNG